MKIGILTYHRAHNYGAVLQAIATRIVFQRMGHEVFYIDYHPLYHRNYYKLFSWHYLIKYRRKYLLHRLHFWNAIKRRIACFERDFENYISPYCLPYDTKHSYDLIVYGSDQIWRKQASSQSFDPVFFGDNLLQTPRHVTYAASMGLLQTKDSDKEFLRRSLIRFSAISVREKQLQDYLLELGIQSTLVCDPTLLLTAEEWDNVLHPQPIHNDGYVLFYSLHENDFDRKAIQDYADVNHLHVVEIKGNAGKDSENVYSQCGVWEFISLIKYANYIFTTSYHGLAFSLIYHKEFFCSFKINADRAQSLLEHLHLQERMLEVHAPHIPTPIPINYKETSILLDTFIINSYTYINEIIK